MLTLLSAPFSNLKILRKMER
ncbi:hypothetical protein ABFA07_020520 [Porites harrisoni]